MLANLRSLSRQSEISWPSTLLVQPMNLSSILNEKFLNKSFEIKLQWLSKEMMEKANELGKTTELTEIIAEVNKLDSDSTILKD